jgi:hypothetical protein
MIFQGTAAPEELALLRTALNDHCVEFGIDQSDMTARETVAGRVFSLFKNGVGTLEEFKLMLRDQRQQP